jgi:optic atrophy 3 protein
MILMGDSNDELARILERVVEIGLRGGWTEFESTPLQLPRIQLTPHRPPTDETSTSQNPSDNDHISNPTPSS